MFPTPNHSSESSWHRNVSHRSPYLKNAYNPMEAGLATPSSMSLQHVMDINFDTQGRQSGLEEHDTKMTSSSQAEGNSGEQCDPPKSPFRLRLDSSSPSPIPLQTFGDWSGYQSEEAGPSDIHGRGQLDVAPAHDIPHWVPSALLNPKIVQPASNPQSNEMLRPNRAASSAGQSQGAASGSMASFSCQTCSDKGIEKTYHKRGDLSKHERIHEERLFKCSYPNCNHLQRFEGHLKRHIMSHYDVRPFKCLVNDCEHHGEEPGQGFERKDQWKRHLRKIHGLAEDGTALQGFKAR